MSRILIVEDSPTQATLLASLLEQAGHEIVVATDGEAALELVRTEPLDLVMSDIIMPGISGYEVCRRIKLELGKTDLPVVLLTGLSDPLDIVRGLESGADNYITKPYEPEHLVSRVNRVLANREIRRRTRSDGGVEIQFMGETFVITAEKEQILDLLISSYEELVRTNRVLESRTTEAEQARKEAEAASKAKSEFLAMMSHELRTPLNAIGGYAQLIEDGVNGPITPEQRKSLTRIRANQEHLLTLINDVLNLARMEAGRVTVQPTDVPVDATLAGAVELIRPQLEAKKLRYEYQGGDHGVTVFADRERLLQIILNLLTNATKFTDEGGRITLGWRRENGTVYIEVKDSGIGIPADRLESIFEPFVQVEQRRAASREGVGLGLAISRELARAMNGELVAESTVGEGSVFTLTLPTSA
ncbi:MAG TPA: ATP-binding protein [Gemmatimonadaceae bacterium]|jgi:two-component system sensor histidine kinase/response regulator|nr:ATP-binding protein [Gemmatimonadaceae bacterium]